MTQAAVTLETQDIVVEQVFPHAPETIWKTLTTAELMSRWLHMNPTGFAPVKGTRFTYQTTAAGAWDGVIQCEVLEVVPNQRLAYSWRGGHDANNGQYGSRLDTVVTLTLEKLDHGTRLRVVHAGFVLPKNAPAFKSMSGGWQKVIGTIGALAGE
ncbi:MAG: SRPBCC domain-containing protein [Pseudomonadota bacterium]